MIGSIARSAVPDERRMDFAGSSFQSDVPADASEICTTRTRLRVEAAVSRNLSSSPPVARSIGDVMSSHCRGYSVCPVRAGYPRRLSLWRCRRCNAYVQHVHLSRSNRLLVVMPKGDLSTPAVSHHALDGSPSPRDLRARCTCIQASFQLQRDEVMLGSMTWLVQPR